MNDYYIRAAVQTADPGGGVDESGAGPLENILPSLSGMAAGFAAEEPDRPVTMAELQRILRSVLSGLRVYVLESDITSSQNSVRTITKQSQL